MLNAPRSCLEHAIHLSAKHVAEEIAPTALSKITKKLKAAMKESAGLDKLDCKVEQLLAAADPGKLDKEDEDNNRDDKAANSRFVAMLSNAVGILMALAKQVGYLYSQICAVLTKRFRSRSRRKPRHSSRRCAKKLTSSPSASFSGSRRAGHRSRAFLTGSYIFERCEI